MNAKHTPGPWNCNRASAGGYNIVVSEIAPIDICVVSKTNKSPAEIDANARLIAAAPELLEALQLCRQHMYDHASNTTDGAFDKLCAAIAKATNHET